ncbi:MAG: sulfurtransferase TusA family protein [Pseudomonadota bacterium]
MSDPLPQYLDLRAGDSPVLPLMVLQALARLDPGQCLEVWLSSPRWFRDLPVILRRGGHRCLDCHQAPDGYRLLLAPARRPTA